MNADFTQKLLEMGLQPNEAAVYLALLEMGGGSVTDISRRANLNRTTGYDILERLCLYGLAGRSPAGTKKKQYLAEPPARLKQYLENKKHVYERRLNELGGLLGDLQSLYKTELKPAIKFAEGKEAMQNLYLHVLDSRSTVYSIINLKNYAEFFDEFGDYQLQQRIRRGVKEKVLAIKNDTALWWYNKTYNKNPIRRRNTEYRWLDLAKEYKTAGEIIIFDDKVIGMLSSPKENIAFEIQSQSFADFLKIIFELAWTKAEKEAPKQTRRQIANRP